MEGNGMIHGNLDPRAQEFTPRYPFNQPHNNNSLPLLPTNQFYYPYSCAPPPLPPPLPPYGDVSSYHVPPAYVSTNPPVRTPVLPPPSSMSTRTLLLSMVPNDVSESIIRRDLEVFGDVRAVQMTRVREGIVTVHFYDLRHAQTALTEIQEQHMQQQMRLRMHYYECVNLGQNSVVFTPLPPPARGLINGRAVWAQFTFPVTSGLPDGNNQGTLVIFNLDPQTSTGSLRDIFQAFGPVKELRETPMKRHQRFVEFYDVRDAARALMEMNGNDLNGKQLLIEFSRPGGNNSRRFSRGSHQYSPPSKFNGHFNNNNYSSRISRYNNLSPTNSPPITPPSHSYRKPQRVYNNTSKSHQFQNQKSNYFKGNPSGGYSGSESSGGGSSVQESLASLCVSSNVRPGKKNHAKKCNNISASSSSSPPSKQLHQMFQQGKSSTHRPWKSCTSKQAKGYDPRFLINEDGIMESNCLDSRTTVMIKNIPNKYSQKLLLNMLDNHCIHCNEQIADGDDQPKSSYDFVYLPIDFINKCNVGYGFVNMTSPEATLRLYKAFHLQNWEVFNSRKICQVTYARLQGIEALKEHFKNSKFPCEAEEYMPVIFAPPRDGKLLTEPNPIVGRGSNSPLLLSAVASSKGEEDQEEESSDLVEVDILVDNENGYFINTSNDDHETRNINGGVGVGENYDVGNDSTFSSSVCMLAD
ncbi:protein terminal ear1 homolog [Lycium ferocissimum]|uniref:protein terminal ear1 homolog n=1 Tax=Lycium ferocissimum TaxID=112874 RepID=UPI002814E1A5|nr:protein terminal ear1 homolog [Lycium ferocissimum]